MELQQKVFDVLRKLRLTRTVPRPPYKHIVQIGDPILRNKCRSVNFEELQSPEMKNLLLMMKKVIRRYKCVGVSAPQVGVDLRVFAMTFPRVEHFVGSPEEYQLKEMAPYPYSVWINPSMKVLDYRKITFPEGCESMRGFCAEVPRYAKIKLTGWDEGGVERTEELSGWLARVVQHEMDHLQGKLYVDTADVSSLACTFWDRVNNTGGRLHLSYYPNKTFSKG